ncbi:hypothetical protein DSO57_1035544 [Entomophthora muscae]|uniref:Uncharacterized protein n=1 Tax=Entomophthora muscae TaxID=34485 RepID=A0ACC2SZH1_9FUNG|nr:hypothetical protein DSO57_1035544 [Entomophthora muscae]
MNTFNFLLSALSLVSATSSTASRGTKEIEIKDNLNYVLKLGTCEQKAEIDVKANGETYDLPYLYPKFGKNDTTSASNTIVTKHVADINDIVNQSLTHHQEFLDKVENLENQIGGQNTVDLTSNLEVLKFKDEFANAKIATLTESVKAEITKFSMKLEGSTVDGTTLTQAFTDLKEAFGKSLTESVDFVKGNLTKLELKKLAVSSDVKQKLEEFNTAINAMDGSKTKRDDFIAKLDALKTLDVISPEFPGHFKIPVFKLKAIKFKGGKKTDFEVYISPPNAHESANIKSLVTFDVDVKFICGAAKNETTKYKFTVTSNARAVSLVSSAAVLAATFFLIL